VEAGLFLGFLGRGDVAKRRGYTSGGSRVNNFLAEGSPAS